MARWQLINDIVYEVTDETATTHKMLKSLAVMAGIHGERYIAQRLVNAHNDAEAQRKLRQEWPTVDQFAAQPDAGYYNRTLLWGCLRNEQAEFADALSKATIEIVHNETVDLRGRR